MRHNLEFIHKLPKMSSHDEHLNKQSKETSQVVCLALSKSKKADISTASLLTNVDLYCYLKKNRNKLAQIFIVVLMN